MRSAIYDSIRVTTLLLVLDTATIGVVRAGTDGPDPLPLGGGRSLPNLRFEPATPFGGAVIETPPLELWRPASLHFASGAGEELQIGYTCNAGAWFARDRLRQACAGIQGATSADECAVALVISTMMNDPFTQDTTSVAAWRWFNNPSIDLAALPHAKEVYEQHLAHLMPRSVSQRELCGFATSTWVEVAVNIGRDGDFSSGGQFLIMCVERDSLHVTRQYALTFFLGGTIELRDEIRAHVQNKLDPPPSCEYGERD
jgi:hypothetical protein